MARSKGKVYYKIVYSRSGDGLEWHFVSKTAHKHVAYKRMQRLRQELNTTNALVRIIKVTSRTICTYRAIGG